MTSDERRLEVAASLRASANVGGVRTLKRELARALGIRLDDCTPEGSHSKILRGLADLIEPFPIDGETSDGYHTFNELYHHRAVLFSVIVATFGERAWKSKLHADGTMYDGMFIVGIETPDGQATYHYDIDPYWNLFRCTELGRAPEWDGHTPNQAIERIGKLADLIDRPTCRNVYDESKTGACKNGFECSECGGVVEDGEGWLVNGTFNFCPECGAMVVRTSD